MASAKLLPLPGHAAAGDGRCEARPRRRRQLSEEAQRRSGSGGAVEGTLEAWGNAGGWGI